MRNPLRSVAPFAAPLTLMALIYAFSAMPSDGTDHGVLVLVLRKLTHFGEYFALTALWWWALRTQVGGRRALAPAVAIAIGYAITDEIHQTFVDGRVGTWRDVLIDSAGALTAAWLIARARKRKRAPVAA
ncbi:MAG TPA: VanZ family protein [Thermoleophilaceae bacterium]|nr:VanZ family protein [Thermoleophilaceae bacterium]